MTRLTHIVLTAFLVLARSSSNAADLTGTIVDQKGKPVPAAIVTVSLSSVDGALRAAQSYMSMTQPDGTFSFKNLPAAPFVICATGKDLIDPCRWNDVQSIHRISEGANSIPAMQLHQGVAVTIRVDDPDQVLTNPAALAYTAVSVLTPGSTGVLLSMGVRTKTGSLQEAWRTGTDGAGTDYTLIVPANTQFALSVQAQGVLVQDTKGNQLDISKPDSVYSAAGNSLTFHYIVRKKP